MDERIRNLMNDRGHPELFLEVDDPELGAKLLGLMQQVDRSGGGMAESIARAVPGQLRWMGQMGIDFLDEVSRVYPDFPRIDRPRSWEYHLPPLPENLQELLERYG